MYAALVLMRLPEAEEQVVRACRLAGISRVYTRGFGPGLKVLVVLDPHSFAGVAGSCQGPEGLRRTVRCPVVVVTPDARPTTEIRRMAEADAWSVPVSDLEYLPALLRRLLWGNRGARNDAAPASFAVPETSIGREGFATAGV